MKGGTSELCKDLLLSNSVGCLEIGTIRNASWKSNMFGFMPFQNILHFSLLWKNIPKDVSQTLQHMNQFSIVIMFCIYFASVLNHSCNCIFVS